MFRYAIIVDSNVYFFKFRFVRFYFTLLKSWILKKQFSVVKNIWIKYY